MLYYKNMGKEFSVIIFDKNQASSELITVYLREFGITGSIEYYSDFVAGYEACRNNSPNFVIIDISENQEFTLDIILKLYKTSVPTIVTSISNSSNTIIKAIRAGASEFLTRPIIKTELFKAIEKILAPKVIDDGNFDSRIITLYSGKGGCGKTTVAANLALELAKQTKKKTALIDLNFSIGELAELLNLPATFNLSTLIETIDKTSLKEITPMFSKYNNTELYLLSEPLNGENLSAITYNRILRFFKLLKEEFAYIIIDTPTIADEKIFKVLQNSDYVLYISSMNLCSLKNSQKCISHLVSKGVSKESIKIILNRFIESDEHSIEEIEAELGHKIYKRIPNNYFTVMSAINKSIPVSEENINSNVAESFRELAIMLSDSIMNSSLKNLRGDYEYKREAPEQ